MQTLGISQFKSHALKILDRVSKTKEVIIITKRGKPLVKIIQYQDSISNHIPGKLTDALVFENKA